MDFLLTILVVWSVAAISPGPNFFMLLRFSLAGRRTEALAAAGGIASGTFVWGISGWLGIATLFHLLPNLFIAFKLIGASYLAYVGVKMLRASWCNQYADSVASAKLNGSVARAFRTGLVTNLSNPKTAIFVSALFAAAMPADISPLLGVAGAAWMMCLSMFWNGLVAYLLTTQAVSNRLLRLRRWLDGFVGVAFLAFAGKLVFSRA